MWVALDSGRSAAVRIGSIIVGVESRLPSVHGLIGWVYNHWVYHSWVTPARIAV